MLSKQLAYGKLIDMTDILKTLKSNSLLMHMWDCPKLILSEKRKDDLKKDFTEGAEVTSSG